MKIRKLIAASILVCSMLSVSVSASDIDLTSMETEALLSLKDSINEELKSRNVSIPQKISSGTFIVGKDIKPGYYLYINTSEKWSDVEVFENVEAMDANAETQEDGRVMLDSLFDNGSATLHLEENMVLVIHGEGTIEKTDFLFN